MMFAEEESVIGTEDDCCSIENSLSFKLFQYQTNVFIVRLDAGVMVLDQLFQGTRVILRNILWARCIGREYLR